MVILFERTPLYMANLHESRIKRKHWWILIVQCSGLVNMRFGVDQSSVLKIMSLYQNNEFTWVERGQKCISWFGRCGRRETRMRAHAKLKGFDNKGVQTYWIVWCNRVFIITGKWGSYSLHRTAEKRFFTSVDTETVMHRENDPSVALAQGNSIRR